MMSRSKNSLWSKGLCVQSDVKLFTNCPKKYIIGENYGKCSKFLNRYPFLFSSKLFVTRAGIHTVLVRIAERNTLIRLFSKKQSDLSLHCLSRPLRKEACV